MTRKPRSHVRILLYRSWAIIFRCFHIILCDFDVIISPSIRQVQLSSIGPLKLGFSFNSVRIWWSSKLAKFGVLLAPTVSKYSKNYLVKINIYLFIFEKVVLQFAKKMLDFLRNLRLACMRKLCGKKKIRHQENFLSYGQCFLAVLFPGLRISRGIFNPFSVRYLWCRKQLTLASRQEDKLQLKIVRSLFIFLLRSFTLQKTKPSTKFSVIIAW